MFGRFNAVKQGDLLEQGVQGDVWFSLMDYFDTIPQDRLMALIRRKVSDGRVLALLEAFLQQGVLDGMSRWTPGQGTPQGLASRADVGGGSRPDAAPDQDTFGSCRAGV